MLENWRPAGLVWGPQRLSSFQKVTAFNHMRPNSYCWATMMWNVQNAVVSLKTKLFHKNTLLGKPLAHKVSRLDIFYCFVCVEINMVRLCKTVCNSQLMTLAWVTLSVLTVSFQSLSVVSGVEPTLRGPANTRGRPEQAVLWRCCQAHSMVDSSFSQKHVRQPAGKFAPHHFTTFDLQTLFWYQVRML